MCYALNINVCQHNSQISTKFLPCFALLIFDRVMASMCYDFNINVCQHSSQISTTCLASFESLIFDRGMASMRYVLINMFVSTILKVLPNLYHFLRHSISPELWPRCVMLSVFRQK